MATSKNTEEQTNDETVINKTRIREAGEKSNGLFDFSIQRTINASAKKAYAAMTEPALLGRWFTERAQAVLKVGGRYSNSDGDKGRFLLLEPRRRLRISWDNKETCPGTVVEVTFSVIEKEKVALRLTHGNLKSKADRERMKDDWTGALRSLKSFLESNKPIPRGEWSSNVKSTRGAKSAKSASSVKTAKTAKSAIDVKSAKTATDVKSAKIAKSTEKKTAK